MKSVQVVQQIEVVTFEEDNFCFRQFARWAFAVDVAADRGDGSDLFEFIEDGDLADVAQVEDVIDTGQGWATSGRRRP
jgi:hypothetical protein